MCDYSLHNVKTRPAKVGDRLITRDFGTDARLLCTGRCEHGGLRAARGRSCPSQMKLGAYVCGRGVRTLSTTRPQSSGKSINTT